MISKTYLYQYNSLQNNNLYKIAYYIKRNQTKIAYRNKQNKVLSI